MVSSATRVSDGAVAGKSNNRLSASWRATPSVTGPVTDTLNASLVAGLACALASTFCSAADNTAGSSEIT